MPQAACIRVFTVTPCRRAAEASVAVSSSDSSATSLSGTNAPRRQSSPVSRVGASNPARALRQAASAVARSCAPSHAKYLR